MAKTRTKKRKKIRRASNQSPPGTWAPDALLRALDAGTMEEKLALLKRIGILTADGEVSPLYQSWGSRVSRTEAFDDPSA